MSEEKTNIPTYEGNLTKMFEHLVYSQSQIVDEETAKECSKHS